MSWDRRVDKDGKLEIIVSRWYNRAPPDGKGPKVVTVYATGFDPYEEVQVEIIGDKEE